MLVLIKFRNQTTKITFSMIKIIKKKYYENNYNVCVLSIVSCVIHSYHRENKDIINKNSEHKLYSEL